MDVIVKLVLHEHMIGGGTTAKMCAAKEKTAWDFLSSNGCFNQDVRVFVNTDPVDAGFLKSYTLKNGDIFNVVPIQKGEAAVAYLVEFGFSKFVASAIVSIATSIAVNFVISTFFGPSDRGFRETRKDPEGYGLTGGSNQTRQFQPLPLVMGTHRIFPDYASPFFVDYVTDFETFRQVCNNTPTTQSIQLPVFEFSPTLSTKAWDNFSALEQSPGSQWIASPDNEAWGTPGVDYIFFWGTGQNCGVDYLLAYRFTPPAFGLPWYDGVVKWTTYADYENSIKNCVDTGGDNFTPICPSAKFKPYAPGTTETVITGYGYLDYETTQRLTNIFSYGFGDLRIYDHYIGTTKATSFKNLQIDTPVFSSTGTSIKNWRRGRNTSAGPLLEYPSNVESIEGGELFQNDQVENDGWVTRETSRKTANYLEIDFAGRLFRNSGGGENLTRRYNAQYRLIGSASWTQAPGFPVDFTNGDTTVFRETLGWSVASGHYEVRVQKVSDDETESANVNDIVFERLKAYAGDQVENYPAINRLGVQILASGQLNGSLDRWSSIAAAKCWVHVGSYAGSYPGAPDWAWQETGNPAWWLLYFCMGGFINKTKPNGWNLGFDSSNEERLFGAGLSNDQIDYQSIVAFAKWCDAKNLSFNAVVDSQRPCADIMIDIASAGRGSPTWSNGKLGVVWADPADIPVAMFGMGNILAGSFEVSYNIERRTDEFVASYNDKDDFYISRQVRATVPGVTQPVNTTSLQLFGITNEEQAQREVNLRAADARYHIRSISFSTSLEGMVPQRGDVILLAHDLTAWAHSGRLVEISGSIIRLPKVIDATGWIQIRLPDGTFYTEQINAGETDLVNLSQSLPSFDDHFPEDYIFQIGPQSTAGKKCRVLSVEPAGNATVKITCTDDYPEYYAQEYSPGDIDTQRDEHLIARVFNVAVEKRVDGNWLVWELENARGVQVSANSIAGSESIISGSLTVPGLELKLPDYPSGTTLQVTLVPDDVVSPISSISESKTFAF